MSHVRVGLAALAATVAFAVAAPAALAAPPHVPGQLIVTFSEKSDAGERAAAHRKAGGTVIERISAIDAHVVQVDDEDDALSSYRRDRAVRFAELDFVARPLHDECTLTTGPNPDCLQVDDPSFTLQYGLQNDSSTIQPPSTTASHDADVDAPFAWKRTIGSSTTRVAILDSGIDLSHEDLAAKVVASKDFTGSSTLDDLYGHGTAVAGVAAPITNNGVGVAGVGHAVSLMSGKVLDNAGFGSCSTVAKGVNWAADNGGDAINLSLGVRRCRALENAVKYAWNKGSLLTAAAGNDGNSSRTYPAYYSQVIAAAATDNADQRASFSQHGNWVDVAAPGVKVYTTFPDHSNKLGKTNYDYGNGTSMSAPFIAGAAGLIWSTTSDANGNGRRNDEVRDRIERYADDIPGTGTLWSAGRLNACNAAAASQTACPLP